MRRTHEGRWRERDHGMWLWLEGKSSLAMAHERSREVETMRRGVHAINEAGLPGLARAPIPGRPTCLTTEQWAPVTEAVRRCPRESGSPRPCVAQHMGAALDRHAGW